MAAEEYSHESLLTRSAERYRVAGRHIASMLERRLHSGVPVETRAAIERTMVVACYTDNALDGTSVYGSDNYQEIYDDSVGFLFSTERLKAIPDIYTPCEPEAWTVRDYLTAHDEQGREAMYKDFRLYHSLNQELRQAREPRLYAALTRLEGKVAMRNILDLLPSNIRNDPRNDRTINWFLRLGQLGNIYDSIADSSTDVRSGRAHAGSPITIRLALSRAAMQDIGPVVRGIAAREWSSEVKDLIGVLRGTTK